MTLSLLTKSKLKDIITQAQAVNGRQRAGLDADAHPSCETTDMLRRQPPFYFKKKQLGALTVNRENMNRRDDIS